MRKGLNFLSKIAEKSVHKYADLPFPVGRAEITRIKILWLSEGLIGLSFLLFSLDDLKVNVFLGMLELFSGVFLLLLTPLVRRFFAPSLWIDTAELLMVGVVLGATGFFLFPVDAITIILILFYPPFAFLVKKKEGG